MKRIILLLCVVALISGCATKIKEENSESETKELKLELVKKDNCENKITKYYESDNQKVYFVCLDEVNLVEDKMTLSYYFNNASGSFEDSIKNLVSSLKETATYNDRGTRVYKNNQMTIITCNKILDNDKKNQDIYIGDENLEFREEFCTETN